MWINSELIGLLWLLLPGFISAGLFRSLISNPKPSGFDSVSQVYVFTVIVQVIGWLIFSFVIETESNSNFSTENHAIVVFVHLLISIVVGILSSLIWNKDWLFKLLRKTKVTEQSSYHSAQYSAFAYYKNCYVVLHLKSQRRLYGWPKEWPNNKTDQHYLMMDCEWLEESKGIPINGVSHILVPANEVELIEFLPIKDSQ